MRCAGRTAYGVLAPVMIIAALVLGAASWQGRIRLRVSGHRRFSGQEVGTVVGCPVSEPGELPKVAQGGSW